MFSIKGPRDKLGVLAIRSGSGGLFQLQITSIVGRRYRLSLGSGSGADVDVSPMANKSDQYTLAINGRGEIGKKSFILKIVTDAYTKEFVVYYNVRHDAIDVTGFHLGFIKKSEVVDLSFRVEKGIKILEMKMRLSDTSLKGFGVLKFQQDARGVVKFAVRSNEKGRLAGDVQIVFQKNAGSKKKRNAFTPITGFFY